MERATVYFTNFRVQSDADISVLDKLKMLLEKAGIKTMDLDQKFTAVKIHFGEPGNLSFLRSNYARAVVDVLKALGARPFLTDCNTLYVGSRRNALDHLDSAYMNGFSPLQTGCHVLIGDGLTGNDHVAVPIAGELCREALIGRAIMDAEAVISLTHFKCHEATGIGGALKNLGMGCGSVEGKRRMHNEGKPVVDEESCVGCGRCAAQCAHEAIRFRGEGKGRKAHIDHGRCAGCGRCVGVCGIHGAMVSYDGSEDMLCKKISEYALAVVQGRPHFHISLVMDVTPFCDCRSASDVPVIADVG
ncbi:MAG: DUF362 domain-containing protein, partial [Clostridia bacterium]|nr:DUF362 domain-containing protein [Clostridia bacterium]